jgi:hypothetical protein
MVMCFGVVGNRGVQYVHLDLGFGVEERIGKLLALSEGALNDLVLGDIRQVILDGLVGRGLGLDWVSAVRLGLDGVSAVGGAVGGRLGGAVRVSVAHCVCCLGIRVRVEDMGSSIERVVFAVEEKGMYHRRSPSVNNFFLAQLGALVTQSAGGSRGSKQSFR